MPSKKNILVLTVTLLGFFGFYVYFKNAETKYSRVTSFEDCVSLGYPVLATYPEQCKIPGRTFVNPDQVKPREEQTTVTLDTGTTTSDAIVVKKEYAHEDYKNTRYTLEGKIVSLLNGTGTVVLIEGSNNPALVSYFGDDVHFDANSDNIDDVAFLLKVDSEVGIPLYYLALAITGNNATQQGANAVFVGENISPQTVFYKNTTITVSYGEKKTKNQKTTTMKSKEFTVRDGVLVVKP